jgi:ribosomal protein L40E
MKTGGNTADGEAFLRGESAMTRGAAMIRSRLTKSKTCTGCHTRLPVADERAKRGDLCDRCYTRALRVLLRPCRN